MGGRGRRGKRSCGLHDFFLRRLGPSKLCRLSPVTQNQDSIANRQKLREFARRHENSQSVAAEIAKKGVDLCFGTDIDPASRFVEQEYPRLRKQPTGEDALLLVSSAQAIDGNGCSCRSNTEFMDRSLSGLSLLVELKERPLGQFLQVANRDILRHRHLTVRVPVACDPLSPWQFRDQWPDLGIEGLPWIL